jgi:cytoskeletal protein RodZ
MIELGQFLKERREERGITLDEIAEKTKIGKRYLLAIEDGNFDIIPGEVYLRGFLRKYSLCVGMDPEETVRRYEKLCQIRDRDKIRSATRKMKREEARQRTRRIVLVLSVVVLLILGGVIYYFLRLR